MLDLGRPTPAEIVNYPGMVGKLRSESAEILKNRGVVLKDMGSRAILPFSFGAYLIYDQIKLNPLSTLLQRFYDKVDEKMCVVNLDSGIKIHQIAIHSKSVDLENPDWIDIREDGSTRFLRLLNNKALIMCTEDDPQFAYAGESWLSSNPFEFIDSGTKRWRPVKQIGIANYDILQKHFELLQKIKTQ